MQGRPYSRLATQTSAPYIDRKNEKSPIRSLQPPAWFAPNLATAGQTNTALPRALGGGWALGFKRTEGQEYEDPTLGVACVGGSGGSTGMASSLPKRTVAACKSSMCNEQVHHIPDYTKLNYSISGQ